MRFLSFVYFFVVLTLASTAAPHTLVAAEEYYYIPSMPKNLQEVDIFLLTSGVGDEIANRFGHTGIRILDKEAKTDVVFNWGKFSFDTPFFLWKFFRGELTYSMGVRSYKNHVTQGFEQKRRMWQDHLNLTMAQKRALIEKIAWNSLPKNRDFSYQYWYKNCATIPRDYIDEVLKGAVQAKFLAAPSTISYRDYVRGNLQAVPFVAPSLDIIMNGNIDQTITVWQDMFLPVRLREHLLALPAIDDEGNQVAGEALLNQSKVLLPFDEEYNGPFNDRLALVGPGMVLLLIGLGLRMGAEARPSFWRPAYRFIGLGTIWYGLIATAFGIVLTLNWILSGHPDTWANANLFLFWPADFFYVVLGLRLFKSATPVRDRWVWPYAASLFAFAHVFSLGLLLVLASKGIIKQDVWSVGAWFGSLAVLTNGVVLAFGLLRQKVPAAEAGRTQQGSPKPVYKAARN